MVSINGISEVNSQRKYYEPQIIAVRTAKDEPVLSFTGEKIKPQKSIGIGEGIGLLCKGFGKQVKEIVSSVVEHPLRTLGVVGATTAGLMMLPLVGIPAAVGGAGLAIGFAGLAALNGVKHTTAFLKNNKNGEYDAARKNLEQIGSDGVDLALSAPFVPKAIKEVKNFAKYGKVAINTSALSKIKSAKGLKGKLSALRNANNDALRAINYNKTTETELAKLTGISDAEKTAIKKYIKDYNVPKDKIAEVVLDQWAKETGIKAKPTLKRVPLGKSTLGSASPSNCEISINNGEKLTTRRASNVDTQRFQQISTKLNKSNYEFTYKDTQTGEIFTDFADKSVVEARENLLKQSKKLTKEANEILTVTHEREHIDQFAKMIASGENLRVSPNARKLYAQMIRDMKPLTPEQIAQYKQMAHYQPAKRTLGAYIMEPGEIGARAKEAELLGQTKFKALDNVFRQTDKMIIPPTSKNIFILNALRAQSAIA